MILNAKNLSKLVRDKKIAGFISQPTIKKYHHPKKKSTHLRNIERSLINWCKENSIAIYYEYKFCKNRQWRFDFCLPILKIAIEYEGGIFMKKSGHNTAKGYTKDAEKYNRAILDGWILLRYTAINSKQIIADLNYFIKMYKNGIK